MKNKCTKITKINVAKLFQKLFIKVQHAYTSFVGHQKKINKYIYYYFF